MNKSSKNTLISLALILYIFAVIVLTLFASREAKTKRSKSIVRENVIMERFKDSCKLYEPNGYYYKKSTQEYFSNIN